MILSPQHGAAKCPGAWLPLCQASQPARAIYSRQTSVAHMSLACLSQKNLYF